jgi:hypothetical protein
MTHILHLGHQTTDVSGITGLLSTAAGGFDPTLDVNAIRFSGSRALTAPFSIAFDPPAGDLWLGFRYVPPSGDSENITEASANFLEIHDADLVRIAQIRPLNSTKRYHAIAHGDTSVQGTSTYTAANGQPQWIDLRLVVGADITIEFHVDGLLQSSATAANIGGKGPPVQITFANSGLHGASVSRTWSYAHLAVLDGVSTIGRRFVRRSPEPIATFNQMAGGIEALQDGDIGSRVSSTAPGQRLSFTLVGPTGPVAAAAIAGVHLKQITQGGTQGPQAAAGFLRMAGVNHDVTAVPVPAFAPKSVYSSWAFNPATDSAWTSASLPAEVGIRSA